MIYAEPERVRGRSFGGLIAYLRRDAGPAGDRVLFEVSRNLVLGIDGAAGEMQATWHRAVTMRRQGQKPDRPVFHFVLSWHQDDRPTTEHMTATAIGALKALGLDEHQAVIIGHDDTDKRHVHIAANVVHPETDRAAKLGYRLRTMSKWAKAYEESQGIIRCTRRFRKKAANENRNRCGRAAFTFAKKQKPDTQPGLRP